MHTDMNKQIAALREMYDLDVVAPFQFVVAGETHTFQCLISGYGAQSGMVIDKAWAKIEAIVTELTERGYGYSCFDIEADDDPSGFSVVLEDWGKLDA